MTYSGSLLLAVPKVTLALETLKLTEGRGGVLIEASRNGLGLLRLTHQDSVTTKDDGHVLNLVPVDPGQDLGPTRVRCTAGDPAQGSVAAAIKMKSKDSMSEVIVRPCVRIWVPEKKNVK
uniref:Uncharacterized protein n=1 Tax=Hippocampus comes TaxID=109280 RepID=A0A3Q2Y049_HIPCM